MEENGLTVRVLIITGEFPPQQGGVGDYTSAIARGLAAQEAQVQVLTSQPAEGDPPDPIDGTAFSITRAISKWNWSSLRTIAQSIQEFAPDIADIQYQTGAYGMHPAINFFPRLYSHSLFDGMRRNVKFVTTFHDLRIPYLFPKAGPVRDWVTRELARSSHAVITTNEQDCARLALWGVPHVSLIPIGPNIATDAPANYERSSWRSQLGIGADELLVCHFGFVNARKGCDTLIRALSKIPRAKLLMIGEQTGSSDPTNIAYLAEMRTLIAELGLAERVLWTGFVPPEMVTANFLASDLCVLPYREGASYQHGTLMAALAHGMPIVTTPPRVTGGCIGTMEEKDTGASALPQLRDGQNCLLVAPDNPDALAQVIERADASPELLSTIRRGASDLAMHFTWDKIVQRQLDLFASMLAS